MAIVGRQGVIRNAVLLVANKQHREAIFQFPQEVVVDLSHPEVQVLNSFFAGDIVDDDNSLRVAVEPVGDRLEPFLTCTNIGAVMS